MSALPMISGGGNSKELILVAESGTYSSAFTVDLNQYVKDISDVTDADFIVKLNQTSVRLTSTGWTRISFVSYNSSTGIATITPSGNGISTGVYIYAIPK